MKKSGSQKSKSPSQLIDARIKELVVQIIRLVPGSEDGSRTLCGHSHRNSALANSLNSPSAVSGSKSLISARCQATPGQGL
jgi:hypothetical protein